MSICIFDPAIASLNVGDQIIRDAVFAVLEDVFPEQQILQIQTQDIIGKISISNANMASYRLIGGTNILTSHMSKYRQWKLSLTQSYFLNKVILLGVGWWQYQDSPGLYTKALLNNVLCRDRVHSVRDGYTENKLRGLGFNNVVNTGCPTMWGLTNEHCRSIPRERSDSVIFTLTDYHQDVERDKSLIRILRKNYANVIFWPQGSGDLNYFSKLDEPDIRHISPTIAAFNEFLDSSPSLDYVGTRLHGGIRAMQKFKRTIIIAVDNRAKEIAKDTNIVVIERGDDTHLDKMICSRWETMVELKYENIEYWRSQFS